MGTLRVKGDYQNLEEISAFVEQAAIEAGFKDSEVYMVILAVDEAVTNIIEHAYGVERSGEITIISEVNGEGITLTLQDQGLPYNPSEVPEPDFSVPLEDLAMRGAGLKIIRKVMDEVRFSTDPEVGNQLTLRKHHRI